jgi:hypothetical protein
MRALSLQMLNAGMIWIKLPLRRERRSGRIEARLPSA